MRYVYPILLALVCCAHAQIVDPNLAGTKRYDGWADLTAINYPGTGSFPGSSAWVSPIASNQPGSNGGGSFNKISGNGYAAGIGIYSPFTFSQYGLSSNSPLSNTENIVFQIYMTTGYDEIGIKTAPILGLNGGNQAIAATDFLQTYSMFGGEFAIPGGGGATEPFYYRVYSYQWNLASFTDPISAFSLNYSVGEHTNILAMRLDQSDTYNQAVPEPSTWALIICGGFAMILFARRRRAVIS